MTNIEEGRRVSHLIGGALLMLVGVLFALQNLGVVSAGRPWDYWPLLLVWVGLSRMLGPGQSRHFASGLVILLLGIVFQLDRLDIVWVRTRDVWPLFLVIAGVALIADSLASRRRNRSAFGASPVDRGGQS